MEKQKVILCNIMEKMVKRETAYLTLLWNDILERSNRTSIEFQRKNCEALQTVNLLKSLKCFVLTFRDSRKSYDNKISQLSQNIYKTYKNEIERIKIKKYLGDNGNKTEIVHK